MGACQLAATALEDSTVRFGVETPSGADEKVVAKVVGLFTPPFELYALT